jgi:hypothetical protein
MHWAGKLQSSRNVVKETPMSALSAPYFNDEDAAYEMFERQLGNYALDGHGVTG